MRRALPLVLLLLAVGCQSSLNQENTVQLNLLEPKVLVVPPIAKEQTIKVSAKSSDGVFNIYIFLEKDQAAAETEIDTNKPGEKILNRQRKTNDAELQASIPANETARIHLISADGKKAEVKVKITN